MKLETFFEKFELFADAPDAVAKMRELVLEMALQGKLSKQYADDVTDPQWQELVQRIEADTDSASAEADAPFEIPNAWRWTTLFALGETKPRNDLSDSTQTSFVPMALIPAEYGLSPTHEVRPWSAIKKGYTHFQNDDVVMAKITPCFENGKSAVMSGLTGGAGAGTTELHVFRRSGAAVLPKFLIIQLKSRGFITRGIPRMTGSAGQKRVPYDYFAKAPFPLPPPAEQKRIVAKVDELMELCDRLEAQQQERETRHSALAQASLARFADAPTPANLDLLFHKSNSISPADLRKSILTLAVQGKLVPQDPNDEPAEALLDRIDSARTKLQKAGIVPKQKALARIAEDECQHPIPDTWRWVRLQRAAEIIDPNPSHRMPRYCGSGVPFISTENFVGREDIDFTIGKQVDDTELENQKKRFNIRVGSFALSRIGTIGKTRILPLERSYCMSHALVVIAPYSQDIDSRFLRTVVSSDAVQGQASHGAKSIGVPDLGMGKIRSFVVPLPPLAEQRRIVAKVDELMALVDALETQLAASHNTGVTLMKAAVSELTAAA